MKSIFFTARFYYVLPFQCSELCYLRTTRYLRFFLTFRIKSQNSILTSSTSFEMSSSKSDSSSKSKRQKNHHIYTSKLIRKTKMIATWQTILADAFFHASTVLIFETRHILTITTFANRVSLSTINQHGKSTALFRFLRYWFILDFWRYCTHLQNLLRFIIQFGSRIYIHDHYNFLFRSIIQSRMQ